MSHSLCFDTTPKWMDVLSKLGILIAAKGVLFHGKEVCHELGDDGSLCKVDGFIHIWLHASLHQVIVMARLGRTWLVDPDPKQVNPT